MPSAERDATTTPAPTDEPTTDPMAASWRGALVTAFVAYALSRLCVIAGAAAAVTAQSIDPTDPTQQRPESAAGGILDVLTSWDGNWYLRVVRLGYPREIPPDVTFGVLEARAAFFPLYPLLVRMVDAVLPGGEVTAGLVLNLLLGAAVIYVVGLLARRLFDVDVARVSMVLMAVFPGSFVLSFAYSEATMVLLAALCLLLLVDERWWLAGLTAGLTTASRPNGIAIVLACVVASVVAIRARRDWSSLVAPLMAPIGLIAFHVFLSVHAGERGVWFRVQREAWDEGLSFGFTALQRVHGALLRPLSSPTNLLTLASVLAMVILLVAAWRRRLPPPVIAYVIGVLALMLLPETVTARPRFVYTAFPLFISFAAWFPRDRWRDHWAMVIGGCCAGLVTLTAVYGAFGAIP